MTPDPSLTAEGWRRRDKPDLIRGFGLYLDDIAPEGVLRCHFVWSTLAHASIRDVDVTQARSREGVHSVMTTGDLVLSDILKTTDLPTPELARITSPATSNPLGAKGIGESGCIGFPPAMVLAVLDALKPLGVQHIDMPLDPSTVCAAIQHAGGSDLEESDEGRLGAGHAREARTNSRTVHLSAECH